MDATAFSLLAEPWLPVRRASGRLDTIRIADLTDRLDGDPVVALAWPRPDLDVATLEFLIGLLMVLHRPPDATAWRHGWRWPPSPQVLQQCLMPAAHAFLLDGDGPRFLQDLEDIAGEELPVERLLIDAPGENTVKKNTDLLVKRGRFDVVSRPAAAIMLFALQAFAPSGGAGHRASLRGGGPLTTLVRPGAAPGGRPLTLWHWLWANVTTGPTVPVEQWPLVFPWLAPTRTSGDKSGGTVLDGTSAHPLQAFWSMPRRIRLLCRPAREGERCGLTGVTDPVVVTGFRMLRSGVQYLDAVRHQTLTPVYFPKPGVPPLAIHLQPEGIGYRHWHALQCEDGARSRPAAVVAQFVEQLYDHDDPGPWDTATLAIYGYDMDNAKARAFVEARMPLLAVADPALRSLLMNGARTWSAGATLTASLLRAQVRAALSEDASVDAAPLSAVREQFFERTTGAFWSMLARARAAASTTDSTTDPDALTREWLATLRHAAFEIFDEVAPLDPLSAAAAGRLRDGKWEPPPVVAARRHLGTGLAGYGKWGEALFDALALPRPASTKRKPNKRASKSSEAQA